MSKFTPKSHAQIIADMAAKIIAETPINDFTDGSVILTLLETAAQEDFQQYIQMLNIIRNYNLDTTEGADLDKRATEYGLTRKLAAPHSGFITIYDTSFTKISTKIYAGLSGPTATTFILNVDDASSFPISGSVYIGRGTSNSEGPITYSSAPVNNGAYWTITLDVALVNDHGTDETIVLSQGGIRTIDSGVEVEIPETDVSERFLFEINQPVILLDGENSVDNVLVTAMSTGAFKVPANSIIAFTNSPFTGASVTNSLPFSNGRDEETDQELRDRIRDNIQSLSRGTKQSIINGILGIIDEDTNTRVTSTNIIEPVILADGPTKVFIDNGSGLEPSLAPVGLDVLTSSATGGEQFFQLKEFPLSRASVISQNVEPFSLSNGESLLINVNATEEIITFKTENFINISKATAIEVVDRINSTSTLVEARTITDSLGVHIILTSKQRTNEDLLIDGTSSAQPAFNFSSSKIYTLKLYKNDKLITKDGVTAAIETKAQPFDLNSTTINTTDADFNITTNSKVITKATIGSDKFFGLVNPGDYVRSASETDIMYAKVKTVVSNQKIILETPYLGASNSSANLRVWKSPRLEVSTNGDISETEVIVFSPNDAINLSTVSAQDVFTRIQKDLNMTKSELISNDTKIRLVSSTPNSANSKIKILGGGAAITLFQGMVAVPISGSVTFTGGGITVTGIGTSFSSLQEGMWIKADADGKGSWTKIQTIESDTILHLEEGYRGGDHIGTSISYISQSEEITGSDKDYSINISNGQIELTTPLASGDSLTAGSVNTRAFVSSPNTIFNLDPGLDNKVIGVVVDGGVLGNVSSSVSTTGFTSANLIGFGTDFFEGDIITFTSGVNTGVSRVITSYNTITGNIAWLSAVAIFSIGDSFEISQGAYINTISLPNALATTVADLVNALAGQIIGATVDTTDSGLLRIKSNNFENGTIKIVEPTVPSYDNLNSFLNFSTELQTSELANSAYVKNSNSDKSGNTNFPGYTLGPDQNLVVILDGDSLNKTFSVTPEVKGTITSVGIGKFFDTSIGAKYLSNDYFKDFWIYWMSGNNAGFVQTVSSYIPITGEFNTIDVFPSILPNPYTVGDTFRCIPRTAENVILTLNDYLISTLAISSSVEMLGTSGEHLQITSKLPGSEGKVYVAGGSANSIGIAVESIPAGSPVNDLTTHSKAGLVKGTYVNLTLDGTVSSGDMVPPYNTFTSTAMISAIPNYFNGKKIVFLDGDNAGVYNTVSSYNNVTGQFTLANNFTNSINVSTTFRIEQDLYISDIAGTTAPYTISLVTAANTAFDVSLFSPQRSAAIRDVNGLNFPTTQIEGTDGYKFYTGLIQKTQWTIDGLDRDIVNYPGIGAAGTQFEVLTPILVKLKITLDVTTEAGISLSSVSNDIRTNVLEYVNSRGVGQDVILSEIIAIAQAISGVFDVSITSHSSNIVIADGSLARLDNSNLIIG